MTHLLSALCMLLGSFFMLVAAIGIVRLPDLIMRMHASTKAGTLGVGLILLTTVVSFDDISMAVRALATILFVFLTAPVASHMIARAAYFAGQVELWDRTFVDELQEAREAEARARERGAKTTPTSPPPDSNGSREPAMDERA